MTQATEIKVPEVVKAPTNIDDLINGYKVVEKEEVKQTTSDDDSDDHQVESTLTKEQDNGLLTSDEEGQERRQNEKEEKEIVSQEAKETKEPKESIDLDEYGNEVPKARLYTEEELNQRIRERLSRGNHNQQQPTPVTQATQQQREQAAQGFSQDPNSNETWEVQLDRYIDKRLESRERNQKEMEWRARELEKQNVFQEKFSTGMERYKDFREVASKMPITDSMMLATRDMKDPAAFIYAASKMHPDKLSEISKLSDPFQQAAEIGRLEERMRKSRNVTKASPPLKSTGSDVSIKTEPKVSIDHTIQSHAKRKAGRR